jgi:hypothetical protein
MAEEPSLSNTIIEINNTHFLCFLQLYQPKPHVKYAPVTQVLSRQASKNTSIRSKSE